jgi:hypothetical protein
MLTLTVRSHTKDGTVTVSINGKGYVYFLDAMWTERFLNMVDRSAGKALQYIKEKAYDYKRLS